MSTQPILEVVLFKLAPGVDAAEFQAAATAVQSWLETVPGYIRRELAASAEGQWVDIVHWASLDEAMQAADAIMATPEGQAFGAMIEPTSIQMLHLAGVASFG
jgi:antibiotic biosynthesis monooxygenase (ABM) superfamily enzyme